MAGLPPLTTEAQRRTDSAEAQRIADVRRGELPAASWTDLGAGVRCIQHAKAGPPISIGGYNNNVQLFQTPDYVVLFAEQSHDARIIPLDGRAHVGATVRQWIGDARGHWEGDTLVVETVHFNGKHDQIGRPLLSGGENLSLVERFTLSEEDTLLYEYTVTDPTIWVRSWTAQRHMKRNPDLIYEFACHEGNYGLVTYFVEPEGRTERGGHRDTAPERGLGITLAARVGERQQRSQVDAVGLDAGDVQALDGDLAPL